MRAHTDTQNTFVTLASVLCSQWLQCACWCIPGIKLLKGSNHLGRLDHIAIGYNQPAAIVLIQLNDIEPFHLTRYAFGFRDQQGADPERVELALKRFEEVYFVAEPGE